MFIVNEKIVLTYLQGIAIKLREIQMTVFVVCAQQDASGNMGQVGQLWTFVFSCVFVVDF
jgi:hypothetical protein